VETIDTDKQAIVTAEAIEFQENILRSVSSHTAPYTVEIKGVPFTLFPDTFNPNYAKASLFLLDHLGVKPGDRVLDPFTGCGADAIFAVKQGAAKAVAIDKFTMPYLCTRYNVARLGLEDKIDVRQGDLVDPLKEDELFDLVVANPPFRSKKPNSKIESAFWDQGYQTLQRFFGKIKNHMARDGRIQIVFSDVGNMDYLRELVRENGFSQETVASTTYAAAVRIEVYEMKL